MRKQDILLGNKKERTRERSGERSPTRRIESASRRRLAGSLLTPHSPSLCSSVTLGDSLDLVLLLDGVAVGAGAGALGGSDDLVGKDLTNALNVSEGRLSRTSGDQVDSLVDAAEGGNVDSLSADDTTGANTGGVLAGASVGDGVDEDLEGVLPGLQVDELEGLLHDSNRHLLLTAVTALHHQRVQETLNNRAVHFLETSLLVAPGSVRQVNVGLDGLHVQVGHERNVLGLDTLEGPSAEKLDLGGVLDLLVVTLDISV